MGGLRGGRAKASLSLGAPVTRTARPFSSPFQALPPCAAAANEAQAHPRVRASAIVTRQGGDGSPAQGKSEPAPGAQRLGRGPSAARETPGNLWRTVRSKFSVKTIPCRSGGIDRLDIVRRFRRACQGREGQLQWRKDRWLEFWKIGQSAGVRFDPFGIIPLAVDKDCMFLS